MFQLSAMKGRNDVRFYSGAKFFHLRRNYLEATDLYCSWICAATTFIFFVSFLINCELLSHQLDIPWNISLTPSSRTIWTPNRSVRFLCAGGRRKLSQRSPYRLHTKTIERERNHGFVNIVRFPLFGDESLWCESLKPPTKRGGKYQKMCASLARLSISCVMLYKFFFVLVSKVCNRY